MVVRGISAAAAAALLLAGCAGGQSPSSLPVVPGGGTLQSTRDAGAPAPLTQVANLNYNSGSITVYRVANGVAKRLSHFTPSTVGAQGLAMDSQGRIYTTISSANGKPCGTCVAVYDATGRLVATMPAPAIHGAKNPAFLTDVSVDANGHVSVSDYGQQAVYVYSGLTSPLAQPVIVAQNSTNAASVLSMPSGKGVFVSGGCGFASVRPYKQSGLDQYQPGGCFGIGTIALIGGATDDAQDVMTPVDGGLGLVSVSSPSGGNAFTIPDLGSVSGIAMSGNGAVAYVADHSNESIYALARPAKGWLWGGQPKVVQTIAGFANLDIIAVNP